MTRKDYTAFAQILADAREEVFTETSIPGYIRPKSTQIAMLQTINRIEHEMMHVFKRDNPRFDADRFRTASKMHG